jgi:galactokinase
MIRVRAPGRVNLIGDHTDHAGGFALPMAIDLATTIEAAPRPGRIRLRSSALDGEVDLDRSLRVDPTTVEPPWGRYVAAVAAEVGGDRGFDGEVTTTLPVAAGLSSSAALEVAVALALGCDLPPLELARACQRAEHAASGVPCGLMDQLTAIAGRSGHALLIDFRAATWDEVPVPDDAEVVVVDSGQRRALADSAYAERIDEVAAAEREIGPLRDADERDLDRIRDERTRRRARHVVTENGRVLAFVAALRSGDLPAAGRLMSASHASFRDDFEASTDVVDALVQSLAARPGVHGARLVGGGFGGCVVALTDPGALDVGWQVRASAGASVEVT